MNLIFEELNFNLSFNLSYVLREIMTEYKDEQPQNARAPILVTESGMVTDSKDLQSRNLQIVLYQRVAI